jgi:hypothetical protein
MSDSLPPLANLSLPVHREVQYFRQWWLWLLIAVMVLPTWSIFIRQIIFGHPVGSTPAPDLVVWILLGVIGLGIPLLFVMMRMVVEVHHDRIIIRYIPIWRRTVAMTDVLAAEAVTYRPIREFTGWGIRWRPGWGWAYSVDGNRGLRVDLRDGSHLMIGSRAPEPLAEAVRMVRGQDTGRPW